MIAAPPSEIRRVVFLGTPDVAAEALIAVAESDVAIELVVSQPDRRRGRGSKLQPTPVKAAALELGLPVSEQLADVEPLADSVDLGLVVAYGRIIPVSLLNVLPMVNIHYSLLPRWRGAAPVERAILAGDQETGVCLMEVAEGLDEGGVYARRSIPIGEDETASALRARLSLLGGELLTEALQKGLGQPEPQLGTPTYAKKIERSESELDFAEPAVTCHRRVRIGRAWTVFRGRRLGVELSEVVAGSGHPGELFRDLVATPDGMVRLIEVKPEGKRTMKVEDWLNGLQPQPGECLGL